MTILGYEFGTNNDALLRHGVSIVRSIRANSIIRELNLSFNGLSPEAGNNIFDALIDNYTIRKVILRGNLLSDEISFKLSELLRFNNIIDFLDLGKFAFVIYFVTLIRIFT